MGGTKVGLKRVARHQKTPDSFFDSEILVCLRPQSIAGGLGQIHLQTFLSPAMYFVVGFDENGCSLTWGW